MKLNGILLLITLIALTASNGQNSSQVINSLKNNSLTFISQGDTVQELGNNIMLVYQDRKNIYWYGSWEEGLYRYDGMNVQHFTTKNGLPSNRIDEIKEDTSGNLYFNTSSGISKFDGKKFVTLNEADLESNWKLEPNDIWFKHG